MNEDLFKKSKDSTKQKIWKDRIKPYIDEEIYQVNVLIISFQLWISDQNSR